MPDVVSMNGMARSWDEEGIKKHDGTKSVRTRNLLLVQLSGSSSTTFSDGVGECRTSILPPTHGMCITGCIPYVVADSCEGTFEAQGTSDNGACAIH